jgi:hypothetical protein
MIVPPVGLRVALFCAPLAVCACDSGRVDATGGPTTRILAQLVSTTPIVSVAQDAKLPLVCQVMDDQGHVIPDQDPVVSALRIGARATCSTFTVSHSGRDTLVISDGTARTTLPVTAAVLPVVSPPQGAFLSIDSLPSGGVPWVVSARRNTEGKIEVYTGTLIELGGPVFENLYRYVSDDNGATFQYDGLVLQHDSVDCSLRGFGIENVAIVPRLEAPGWRLYFSGGSFDCYGWQVFSAVSTDERTWTVEPGVRLGNTADGEPDQSDAIWPVGEGMTVNRSDDGTWRMIVGGYEHILPPESNFQIVEWTSSDQLQWTYVDTLVTTRQMPPEANAVVYSPTIREFAPGLWRMIFAAYNRAAPDARGRLWSAVSTDQRSWQLEGPLIESDQSNYYYSSLVDDFLVFVREDSDLPPFQGDDYLHRLAAARVSMP